MCFPGIRLEADADSKAEMAQREFCCWPKYSAQCIVDCCGRVCVDAFSSSAGPLQIGASPSPFVPQSGSTSDKRKTRPYKVAHKFTDGHFCSRDSICKTSFIVAERYSMQLLVLRF
jgi:hypothetical protein